MWSALPRGHHRGTFKEGHPRPKWRCCLIRLCVLFTLFTKGNTECVYFDFEEEWEIDREVVKREDTCPHVLPNGTSLPSLEIRQNSLASTDVASYTFSESLHIEHFSFSYFEWRESNGGGVRLMNERGEMELGVLADNPELEVDHGGALRQVDKIPTPHPPYEQWIQVDVEIAWDTREFSVTWSQTQDDVVIDTFRNGKLKNGLPVKEIRWSNAHGGELEPYSTMHMRICGVQYAVNSTCPAGHRLSVPCSSCSKCPSRAVSEKGSTICSSCSTGRYSDGLAKCLRCPPGTSSDEGVVGENECLDCPKANLEFPLKSHTQCVPLDFMDQDKWSIHHPASVQLIENGCPHEDGCKHSQSILHSFHSSETGSLDVASYTFNESLEVDHFAFSYYEWKNNDGAIHLLNDQEEIELSILTNKPLFSIDHREGIRHAAEGSVDQQYHVWIRVQVSIRWDTKEVSVTWSFVQDTVIIGTLENLKLKKGCPIKQIRWSKSNLLELDSEPRMRMRICGIQYAVNATCPAGHHLITPCFSCMKCPSGAISEQGSTTCKLCPPGSYSNGLDRCLSCPLGRSSYEGTLGNDSCFACPQGNFGVPLRANGTCEALEIVGNHRWSVHEPAVQVANGICPYMDDCGHHQNSWQIFQSSLDSKDAAVYTLKASVKIKNFAFSYYEWGESTGGGMRLLNEHEQLEMGVGTDNPEFIVDDGHGFWRVAAGPFDETYEVWIRVDIEIAWDTHKFSATWSRVRDNFILHTFTIGMLKHGYPIKYIRWSNLHGNEWSPDSHMYMRICGVQYAINVTCPAGYRISTPCHSCTKCPSGAVSDEGSNVCQLCSAGRYSDGRSRCLYCRPGKTSREGTSVCFTCPSGTFSLGGGRCLPCSLGKVSYPGTSQETGCFRWTYPTKVVDLTSARYSGWTIHDEQEVRVVNVSFAGDQRESLQIESPRTSFVDVASYTLSEPAMIQHLVYYYFEWKKSKGGGVRLINENDGVELGVMTDNPQLEVDHRDMFEFVDAGFRVGDGRYEVWNRVDIIIQWHQKRFSVVWTRLDDGAVLDTFVNGRLKEGLPIKEIRWSNGRWKTWKASSSMYMRLCDVQYVPTNKHCMHFDFRDTTQWVILNTSVHRLGGACAKNDGSNSLEIRHNSSTEVVDVALFTLHEPLKIDYFSFSYRELDWDSGGGIRLLNGRQEVEFGILAENSKSYIDDGKGFRKVDIDWRHVHYGTWIRVEIEVSWITRTLTATWSRVNDDSLMYILSDGKLKVGEPINDIRWSNGHRMEWTANSSMNMQLCGVQYAVNMPCPAGHRRSTACSCTKCPPEAPSPEGSSICKPCSPGRYSHGISQCLPCLPGKGSYEGALNSTECFECPSGKFSHGGSQCLDCPSGQMSHIGASTESECVSPSPTCSITGTPSTSLTPTSSDSPTSSATSSETVSSTPASQSASFILMSSKSPSLSAIALETSTSTPTSQSVSSTPTLSESPSLRTMASETRSSTPSESSSSTVTPSTSLTSSRSASSTATLTGSLSPSATESFSPSGSNNASSNSSSATFPTDEDVSSSTNSSVEGDGMSSTILAILPVVLVVLVIGVVLILRQRNKRIRALQNGDRVAFSSQLGISMGNLQIAGATQTNFTPLEDKNERLSQVSSNGLPQMDDESSRYATEQGPRIAHINPLAKKSQATKDEENIPLPKKDKVQSSFHASHGVAENGVQREPVPASSQPQVTLVHISSDPHSIHASDVRVVSTASPKLDSGERSNKNNRSMQVALASEVNTSNMKKIDRTKLKLRQWKAKMLAEAPPLVQIETSHSEHRNEAYPDHLRFAMKDARDALSNEAKQRRHGGLKDRHNIWKKEFAPSLPSDRRFSSKSRYDIQQNHRASKRVGRKGGPSSGRQSSRMVR